MNPLRQVEKKEDGSAWLVVQKPEEPSSSDFEMPFHIFKQNVKDWRATCDELEFNYPPILCEGFKEGARDLMEGRDYKVAVKDENRIITHAFDSLSDAQSCIQTCKEGFMYKDAILTPIALPILKEVQGENLCLEDWPKALTEQFRSTTTTYYFHAMTSLPDVLRWIAANVEAPLLAQIKQLQAELGKAGKETNY